VLPNNVGTPTTDIAFPQCFIRNDSTFVKTDGIPFSTQLPIPSAYVDQAYRCRRQKRRPISTNGNYCGRNDGMHWRAAIIDLNIQMSGSSCAMGRRRSSKHDDDDSAHEASASGALLMRLAKRLRR
jgi:hypothetical protein